MPGITAWAAKNWCRRLRGDPLVPVGGRDVLDPVPVVAGGVVDQHRDRPAVGLDLGHGRLQGRDITQIAADEARRRPELRQLADEGLRGVSLDVEETHPRALAAEMLDEAGTDAGAAARDQDGPAARGSDSSPPQPRIGTHSLLFDRFI